MVAFFGKCSTHMSRSMVKSNDINMEKSILTYSSHLHVTALASIRD